MLHDLRIVPDETSGGILALHRARYEFALPLCAGATVLDAGCGAGYGTALLAEVAEHVTGIDADDEAVTYARGRYDAENIRFEVMDVQRLGFRDASFDTVCCFETIEHLDDPEAHIAEVARVLRPQGVYIVSTPRAPVTTHDPSNPHHRVEYSPADFEALLRSRFGAVELYGQIRRQSRRHRLARRLDVLGLRRRSPTVRRLSGPLLGTPATTELGAADIAIEPGVPRRATELVAVCRRG